MTEGDDKPSPEDFDARLKAARSQYDSRRGQEARQKSRQRMEGIGFAFRVGTELVAATGIGVGIGWGLDQWLGTKPWLMLLFLFIGGGAGVVNVYKLASGMDTGIGWRRAGDSLDDENDRSDTDDGDDGNGPRRS